MKAAAQAAVSERFDTIVAAGGDGTVHDVAAGLLGTPVPLGIVPMGTANVFAREVGLSRSPERVASTLMNGKVGTIPVGQINGQLVLFVVGIGFDAEAVHQFEAGGTRRRAGGLLTAKQAPEKAASPLGLSIGLGIVIVAGRERAWSSLTINLQV